MAEEKKTILTREGYDKLVKELDYYISVRRNQVAEQIAIARGFGDLSENAEYDEAKNEQSRLEAKIAEMENTLHNCIIVEDDEMDTETVGVGNTTNAETQTLQNKPNHLISTAHPAEPPHSKISSESPIGAALLGKKVGQTAIVEAPAGQIKLKVLKITLQQD